MLMLLLLTRLSTHLEVSSRLGSPASLQYPERVFYACL